MSNLKPNFPTVIKTIIQSITKHPRNICPNSKHNTNQSRITFQPDISKSHLLNFLHSMYNPKLDAILETKNFVIFRLVSIIDK